MIQVAFSIFSQKDLPSGKRIKVYSNHFLSYRCRMRKAKPKICRPSFMYMRKNTPLNIDLAKPILNYTDQVNNNYFNDSIQFAAMSSNDVAWPFWLAALITSSLRFQ